MYTEISHFLLLHAIFLATFWICKFHMQAKYASKERAHMLASKPSAQLRLLFLSDPVRKVRSITKSNSLKISILAKTHACLQGANPLQLGFAPSIFSIFFFTLTISFFGTISNYVCSDFSIYNILTNSTADIPLFYKISATWSNHEGSLLLWCWLLSANTFLFCISIRNTQFALLRSRLACKLLFSGIISSSIGSNFCFQMYKKIARPYRLWISSNFFRLPEGEFANQKSPQFLRIRGSTQECYQEQSQNGHPFIQLKKNEKINLNLGKKIRNSQITKTKSRHVSAFSAFASFGINQVALLRRTCLLGKNICLRTPHKSELPVRFTLLGSRAHKVTTASKGSGKCLHRNKWSWYEYHKARKFNQWQPREHALCLIRTGNSWALKSPQVYDEGCHYLHCLRQTWVLSFHSTKPLELFRENDENLGNKTELPASIILIFFSFFCVATSNPFLRTSIPCISSLAELNPILQDPVLAIHPPCIYAGYVASAIVFCICMSSFYKNPGTK